MKPTRDLDELQRLASRTPSGRSPIRTVTMKSTYALLLICLFASPVFAAADAQSEGLKTEAASNEKSVWFTQARDTNTVYSFETNVPWEWATWRDFALKSACATPQTEVSVASETGDNRCWSTEICRTTWKQDGDTLRIHAMFAQRLYTNCRWPNPIVLRITHAEPVSGAVPELLKADSGEQRLFARPSR
jgi:hypothetical protein